MTDPPTGPLPPPPAPRPAPPAGYPTPGRSGPSGWLILSIVLAVAFGIVIVLVVADIRSSVDDAVDEFGEDLAEEQRAERDDVEVEGCDTNEDGVMVADLEVTNHSSGPSTYLIGVVFETPDGTEQLATAFVSVPELQPDQFTRTEAVSDVEPPAPEGTFTCDLLEVERFSS